MHDHPPQPHRKGIRSAVAADERPSTGTAETQSPSASTPAPRAVPGLADRPHHPNVAATRRGLPSVSQRGQPTRCGRRSRVRPTPRCANLETWKLESGCSCGARRTIAVSRRHLPAATRDPPRRRSLRAGRRRRGRPVAIRLHRRVISLASTRAGSAAMGGAGGAMPGSLCATWRRLGRFCVHPATQGRNTRSSSPTDVVSMSPLPGVWPESSSAAARLDPTPIGTSAAVDGGNWAVTVTGPAVDLTEDLSADPAGAFRFVGVPIRMEHAGSTVPHLSWSTLEPSARPTSSTPPTAATTFRALSTCRHRSRRAASSKASSASWSPPARSVR